MRAQMSRGVRFIGPDDHTIVIKRRLKEAANPNDDIYLIYDEHRQEECKVRAWWLREECTRVDDGLT